MSEKDLQNITLTPQQSELLSQLVSSGILTENQSADTAAEPALIDLLDRDAKGKIRQTNENCQLVLRYDELLKNAIQFNELSGQMDILRSVPWKRFTTAFTDNDLDNIITYMEMHYGLHKDKLIERAVRIVAKENSYHPIRNLLLSLKWDGKERLANVMTRYLGVEATPLAIESLKLFMLGAISRVFSPGCKFEYMLCLVGGQGAGKSSFLRYLAMDDRYFTDDIKKLNDKSVFEQLNGHWILEVPEMLAILHAKYVEETKSFISRQSDNYRTPYDKFSADHPRQCVFAGTSNKIAFLPPDKSGNRRFLPIEVNMEKAEVHINENEAETREYFSQLWAEVMQIFLSGNFKLTLSPEMQEALSIEQQKFMPEDPMETDIINFIEDNQPQYVCVKMLFIEALGHSTFDTLETWQSNAIGEIMNQCFKDQYKKISSHKFKKYDTQRAWIRCVPVNEPDFEPITPLEEKDIPF